MKDLGDIRGGIITFPSGFVIDAVCKNVFYCNCCVTRYVVVVFNYLLVTQCYTEDSCRPAIIDSRQKQRSQISFHALSFQKI